MSKDAQNILHCPFCGGDAALSSVRDEDERRWFSRSVSCEDCDASDNASMNFFRYSSMAPEDADVLLGEMAISSWNKRAPQPDVKNSPDTASRDLAALREGIMSVLGRCPQTADAKAAELSSTELTNLCERMRRSSEANGMRRAADMFMNSAIPEPWEVERMILEAALRLESSDDDPEDVSAPSADELRCADELDRKARVLLSRSERLLADAERLRRPIRL